MDGIPIAAIAGSPADSGLNLDLFDSARVNPIAGGGTAGTVTFYTLQPTQKPEAIGSLRSDANGDYVARLTI